MEVQDTSRSCKLCGAEMEKGVRRCPQCGIDMDPSILMAKSSAVDEENVRFGSRPSFSVFRAPMPSIPQGGRTLSMLIIGICVILAASALVVFLFRN